MEANMFNKISALGLLAMLILVTGCTLLNPPLPLEEKTYEEKLLEVAKRVPEFGGLFFKDNPEDNYRRYLCVYLLNPERKAEAEAAIESIFGKGFIPLRGIQILQGQYSFLQLQEWHAKIVQKGIREITRAVVDEAKNRLVVWLGYGEAKDLVQQELDRLAIPREAVILVIEFAKYTELDRWLEMPSKVRAGEIVSLKLKVKNRSNSSLYIPLKVFPYYNFIVTRLDNAAVWCKFGVITDRINCNGVEREGPIEPVILNAQEELELTAAWDQRDWEDNSVSPGTYWVRGILYIGGWPDSPKDRIETEPKPLVIER
jgi:hypothetical protein